MDFSHYVSVNETHDSSIETTLPDLTNKLIDS